MTKGWKEDIRQDRSGPSCPSWSPHAPRGHLMVTSCPSWSPHAPRGHLMPLVVTSWSPHGRLMVASCPPRGHLVVTSWSPPGRLVVTSWSPHGHLMPLMVTSWSPHDHPGCLSAVINQRMRQRFDPYKLGDCASWLHIWRPPAPYRFFRGVRWTPMGGLGGSHTYIYFQRYRTPK